MKSLGKHLIVELYDCNNKILNDVREVERVMVDAAKKARAHIVDVIFHSYNPQGVSGVVVIAESHLAIHTWPEYAFASVDIYTCGEEIDPWVACEYIESKLKARNSTTLEMKRGVIRNKGAIKHKNL